MLTIVCLGVLWVNKLSISFSEKAKRPLTSDYCFSSDVSHFNYCLTQRRPEYELHSQPVPIFSLDFLIIFPESIAKALNCETGY